MLKLCYLQVAPSRRGGIGGRVAQAGKVLDIYTDEEVNSETRNCSHSAKCKSAYELYLFLVQTFVTIAYSSILPFFSS